MKTGIILLLSLFAAMAPQTTFAQSSTASVNGTVRDASGGVAPATQVVLRNTQTGVDRSTLTNSTGNYAFLNVPSGTYTLEITKAGFSLERVAPFTLEVNQTATFDAALSVGSVQQTVEVQAVGAAVQASTAELGAVVTSRQVAELPLNGRNFTQLLSLTPGTSPISVAQNANGGNAMRAIGDTTFPAVNGQPNRSNLFTLDGINNLGSLRNTYAVPPVIDGIQEFKVQSHNDQAEFGGVLGGIINVVTKSGTNALHGALWEFLRNDKFDARGFFSPGVTPFKQNQFGVAAGGPVVLPKLYNGRNRTFFYMTYQGYRYRLTANQTYRIPTAANLAGNLADQPTQIFNPYTTRANPNGTGFVRDPFPGNQIPASMIDATSLAFVKATLPSTPVATGIPNRNALDNSPVANQEEDYSARVDQNVGRKDFFWFRYSGLLENYSASAGRQILRSLEEHRTKNLGLSWVHTFGPSSVLQTQYGRVLGRDETRNRFAGLPADFGTQIGFSNQFAGNYRDVGGMTPNMSVPDFFAGGEQDQIYRPTDIHEGKADYSRIIGTHTLKVGGNFESNGVKINNRLPNLTYAVTQTNNPQVPGSTGNTLASFLLDLPDTAERRNTVQTVRFGGTFGFYFQDQWKVTPKLTVNLGIRYDRSFIPPFGRDSDDNVAIGDLNLNDGTYIVQELPPTCAVKKVAPCIPTVDGSLPAHVVVSKDRKIYHDTTMNWQPRVGLAYRLRPKTALRASFGIFFDEWSFMAQLPQNFQGAWPDVARQVLTNLNVPTAAQPTPTIKGTNPFLNGSVLPGPTPFTVQQNYIDPFIKNPYSIQYNFGIQHELNNSTVVTANYVGSGSRRLGTRGYYNTALFPGPGSIQSRVPYPYITQTLMAWSWGRSSYNALQLLLDKKYANGMAVMASYTWSKAIDLGCSGFAGEACNVQNPYDLAKDRAVSGFDLTHILSVSWVYELPFGKGKRFEIRNRAAAYVLGNWQLNGITKLNSGAPYSVTVAGDIANIGQSGAYMMPNLVGNPNLSNPTPTQWIDKKAFAAPPLYTFGNFGRDRLRADWTRNFDLSVFRRFRFKESRSVEFRTEAFNTFNTPVFGAANSNFSSQNFGQVTSTTSKSRQLQFSLKLLF